MDVAESFSVTKSMKQKTILYLKTDIMYQKLVAGGSVTHTLGVIQGFQQLGYEIVCASSTLHELLAQQNLKELKHLQNPAWLKCLRWKLNCLFSNIFFFFQALPLARKHPIAFVYQRYSAFNVVGVVLSKLLKKPLLLEYNGSEVWVDTHWSEQRSISLRWLMSRIELINLKRAHHIIVVSQALHDELVARGIKQAKIIVNPNGVDTARLDPALLLTERDAMRVHLKLQDKKVIGFIGTFSAWHGINVISELIPILVRRYTDIHFMLIGDGPLKSKLQEQLRDKGLLDRVTLPGMVAPEQARHYLAACDIFLSPTQPNPDGSRFFGSPTKVFEYMSLAKPIIASDLEQLAQVLNPALRLDQSSYDAVHTLGILVSPSDLQGFIRATEYLLAIDPTQLQAMGYNARSKAIKQYTWQAHVQRMVERMHG